jgi:hypothetical protein
MYGLGEPRLIADIGQHNDGRSGPGHIPRSSFLVRLQVGEPVTWLEVDLLFGQAEAAAALAAVRPAPARCQDGAFIARRIFDLLLICYLKIKEYR